jgi:glycogen synthase
MKILFVSWLCYRYDIGGAESGLKPLAEELSRREISVVVVCLARTGGREQNVIGGVRIIRIPLANVYWPFERDSCVGRS